MVPYLCICICYSLQFVICVDIDFHKSARNLALQNLCCFCARSLLTQIALDTTHDTKFSMLTLVKNGQQLGKKEKLSLKITNNTVFVATAFMN